MLKINHTKEGTILYLNLVGEVNSNTAHILDDAFNNIDQDTQEVVLDLSELTFISSMGLRSLLKAQKMLDANGGKLSATHVSPNILSTLEMVNFTDFILIK
ncbi:MAG: STAS domain-containing protein [Bacteroidales bacterium]|nr:STAS domain-containing protein [Bacteroidales bacterium]